LGEQEYEAERKLIGDLDSLDSPATVARLEAAPGHGGERALEMLERMRAEAPDDPCHLYDDRALEQAKQAAASRA